MAEIMTTPGKLMFNQALPEELRSESLRVDKKSITKLLTEVAKKYPDQYADILQSLSRLGARVASDSGASISSAGLGNYPERQALSDELDAKVQNLRASIKDDKKFQDALIVLVESYRPKFEEIVRKHGSETNSAVLEQIVSGARGNITQLGSMAGADLLVTDHVGNVVPYPITRNYGMGLSPAEYFASLFGTRKGLLDTKLSVADAGFFNKQTNNSAHRLVITDKEPKQFRLPTGLPVDPEDVDYYTGLVLASDVGPYKAKTLITPKIAADLRGIGKRFLVYSPMTSITKSGGIDSISAGVRETGSLPEIGVNIGLPAAQSISEKISQGMLNCLAKGTLVRMADLSIRKIEELIPGEYVIGSDEQGNLSPVKVNYVFNNGLLPVSKYIFNDRQNNIKYIKATGKHRVLFADGVRRLNTLEADNGLIHLHGIDDKFNTKLTAVHEEELVECYDIEVDSESSLYLLACGIVTHNSKHTAGVGSRKVNLGGFEYINNLIQAPETFRQAGPLAPEDGVVKDIRVAPQGGHYVKVNDQELYVYPEQELVVKVGQRVEAGDDISDGIPHPAKLVEYKGIGEARRRYFKVFQDGLKNSGIEVHPRNIDTLVTGLINHARVTDPDGIGDFVIDDTLNYNRVFANYTPRKNSKLLPIKQAKGKYLEEPVLHYTVGTRVDSKVLNDLKDFGIEDLEVNDEVPKFKPYFQRSLLSVDQDEDWITRLGGWYTAKGFQDSVAKGSISDSNSTSFLPAVANPVNIGSDIKRTGRY